MVHELGAPHICPPERLRRSRSRALAAAGRRCPRSSATGASSAPSTRAGELGCAGAAGDLCVDGAIGSRTAALHAPYADARRPRGHLYLDADQVAAHVVACTEAGLQAGFHVIGDRAVADGASPGSQAAAERLGAAAIVRARHRLEHVEMVVAGADARSRPARRHRQRAAGVRRLWGGDRRRCTPSGSAPSGRRR